MLAPLIIVPDIQVPNVTVNEDEGIAEVCIEIRNQIESPFTVEYGTRELSNSASGKKACLIVGN